MRRIALSELGFLVEDTNMFTLMGVWDHFYPNSAVDQKISTHYINLPHYTCFESRPEIAADDQHSKFEWFNLKVVANNEGFYTYIKNYADWLIKKGVNVDY